MRTHNSSSHNRHCGNQFPVKGMESVVATVSGYNGSERFDLIRMISRAGANFVGTMSRSATHLVCWKFEGKKYDLAKKFGTIVVNHQWFEDCIRRGRRIPEGPYTSKSGEEVGPLSRGVKLSCQANVFDKKRGVLSERASRHNISQDDTNMIDMGCGGSEEAYWNISLNEDLFLDIRNEERDYVRQNRKTRRSVKQVHGSSNRHLVQCEGPSSSVKHSEKGKRKISEYDRTSSPANHKGRRLFKKNVQNNVVDLLSDSDQECCPTRVLNTEDPTAHSDHLVGVGNVGHEDVKEFQNWNRVFNNKGSNNSTEKPPIITERTGDGSSDAENTQRKIKDDDPFESYAKIPSPVEVSCVICWTDFSSTRGVLPCGHRFCYSCIQNWADHMVARRKNSTCPLCKATFTSIMKVEDAATSDQKIYSQTIPIAPSTRDIFILFDQDAISFRAQSSQGAACSKCRQSEPEDCLISCHLCHIQRIHSYCLDPPLLPWTCIHCKDLQNLYLYNR